jgi:hypothetical protein
LDARVEPGHDDLSWNSVVAVTVFAVYEPPTEAEDLTERADRLAFVKEGFSWPALFIPLLWLIYHRMWIELILLTAIYVALPLAFGTDLQGQTLTTWASLAISVLFAFEANDLRAMALERRGYRLASVAMGRDRTDAERSFFSAWLPQQSKTAKGSAQGGEPRRGTEGITPVSRGEGEEVIGLFPQP